MISIASTLIKYFLFCFVTFAYYHQFNVIPLQSIPYLNIPSYTDFHLYWHVNLKVSYKKISDWACMWWVSYNLPLMSIYALKITIFSNIKCKSLQYRINNWLHLSESSICMWRAYYAGSSSSPRRSLGEIMLYVCLCLCKI